MDAGYVEGTYLAWLEKKPKLLGRMMRAMTAGGGVTAPKIGKGFWPSYVAAARCRPCGVVMFFDER